MKGFWGLLGVRLGSVWGPSGVRVGPATLSGSVDVLGICLGQVWVSVWGAALVRFVSPRSHHSIRHSKVSVDTGLPWRDAVRDLRRQVSSEWL